MTFPKSEPEDLQTLQDIQDVLGADGLLHSLMTYLAENGFEDLAGDSNQQEVIQEFLQEWRAGNEPERPEYLSR